MTCGGWTLRWTRCTDTGGAARSGPCGYGQALSVGWGDIYHRSLPGQSIDISTLATGSHRLWATADQANFFEESNDANNSTWADLWIDAGGVTVLQRAPNP